VVRRAPRGKPWLVQRLRRDNREATNDPECELLAVRAPVPLANSIGHRFVTAARAVASRRKPAVMYYACEERAYAGSGTVMGPTSSRPCYGPSRARVAAQCCGASAR